MSRHDLTDVEWKAIRFHLPREKNGRRGRPWNNHRLVINGILFMICTGVAWRDLPECYGKGKWQTVYNRLVRWTIEGLWKRIWHRLIQRPDRNLLIGRQLWCIDGSVIRAGVNKNCGKAKARGRGSSIEANELRPISTLIAIN